MEDYNNFNHFMCGDVEKNPGPYNIAGIDQASFSQGHEKFGVTRGIYFTRISLYNVWFSGFKSYFWVVIIRPRFYGTKYSRMDQVKFVENSL